MDNEVRVQKEQQLQERHLVLTVMSILSITFWIVIWVMHLCALTNAKMKFNKRDSHKNTTKLKLGNKQRYYQSNPHHHLFYSREQEHKLFDHTQQEEQGDLQRHDQVLSIANKKQHTNHLCNVLSSCPLPITNSSRGHMGEMHNGRDNNLVNMEHDASIIDRSPTLGPLHLNASSLNDDLSVSHDEHRSSTPPIFISETNQHDSKYISLPLPGVSILKPLVGVDKNLFYNLETFFHLDYPTYEILFCVQDPCDAAISVVEELFKKYPNADARLFIGGARVGVNPKINNMQPAYEHMKHELILISDSGISMRPDTLTDMVSHMTDEVALVHQMPFVYCHGRDNFQSIVERVYFGTAHARAYLTADLLNINCPTGMSALMRKCLLDEVGGIKAFSHYLAEDFFFAKSFTDRGWKIRISSQPALQNSANSSDTLSTFNSRIQRWIKLRFAMVPLITLLEPFSECMLLGLLGALSMSFLWAFNPFLVFILHVILWFTFDYQLLCTIQNGPPTCRKRDYLAAWLIRECTALLVFIKAVADPKVNWRSREFKIRWGGYTEEVSSPGKLAELDMPAPISTQKSTDYVQQQIHHRAQLQRVPPLFSRTCIELDGQQENNRKPTVSSSAAEIIKLEGSGGCAAEANSTLYDYNLPAILCK